MKQGALVVAAAALALAAGCQGRQAYTLHLQQARDALVADAPELAEHHVARARDAAVEDDLPPAPAEATLLAETRLRQGRLDEAAELAEGVRAVSEPGTTARAQAEELLGKVALRRGAFDVAEEHFVQAAQHAPEEVDRQRAADLLALVRGLGAYARGDAVSAREHWDGIADAELRLSVLTAVDSRRIASGQE